MLKIKNTFFSGPKQLKKKTKTILGSCIKLEQGKPQNLSVCVWNVLSARSIIHNTNNIYA